jgi:hypothetical protein
MMSSPGNAVGVDAPCDASTRVANPLGGLKTEVWEELHEKKLRLLTNTTTTSATLFKQEAPNDMKNGDLGAK